MAFLFGRGMLSTIKIDPIEWSHKYDVKSVVRTFFTKFPNPSMPEVEKVEVLQDEWKEELRQHHRRRRYHITNTAGWPLSTLLGWSVVVFEEKSIWDEREQTLFMHSQNITGSNIILGTEDSTFKPHPSEPGTTVFHQIGGVEATQWFGPFVGSVEAFVAPSFLKAGTDACKLLDQILDDRLGAGAKKSADAAATAAAATATATAASNTATATAPAPASK